MENSIGWINGKWGALNELMLPISDRGVTLADGIFETILISEGKPRLFKEHLLRWKNSANALSMNQPPSEEWLNPLVAEGIGFILRNNASGVLRLNWSRGISLNRGIDISEDQSKKHSFWLEIHELSESFNPITSTISKHEYRNPYSILSKHKTFSYGQSIYARQAAKIDGYDDALFSSTTGEICCGTTSNLIILRNNEFLTPRKESGCLQGIMREVGIQLGILKEVKLEPKVYKNDQWLLINSLSCKPIRKINNMSLNTFSDPKKLWLSIINKSTDQSII